MKSDVVVYGGTPGGVAAAVAAAREGLEVALVNPQSHLGGMAASGLASTDAVRRDAFGGIFREFIDRVRMHYAQTYGVESDQFRFCRDGWYYESSVAEQAFDDIVGAERNITLLSGHTLTRASAVDDRAEGVTVRAPAGDEVEVNGSVIIDGTYEGDVAAAAGVPYRVGREGREEFGEEHAGIVYRDWRTGRTLPESTGEPHDSIQAYCFRMMLTDDDARKLPIPRPESIDGHVPDYLPILRDIEAGVVRGFGDVIAGSRLANGKRYANGHIEAMTSMNGPGRNWDYPDADDAGREESFRWHLDHAVGLLWWLQHDPRLPSSIADEARRWGLPSDEFVESDHLPWQLYVRQARRIEGRYTLTEHDFRTRGELRPPIHVDSIAVGEHSFDIHPCQDRSAAIDGVMEGVLWYPDKRHGLAQPGQVPYGAMLPRRVDGLLVPVALSATHVAFSALRMEPLWMATGQAAGVAASISVRRGIRVADVPVSELQEQLVDRGQIITYFEDLAPDGLNPDPAHVREVQLHGTAECWNTYVARNHFPAMR